MSGAPGPEALERLFAVIVEEARSNPGFANRLLGALEAALGSGEPAPKAGRRRTDPVAAPALDPLALVRDAGTDALRAELAALTKADIVALVKAQDFEPRGVSTFNKPRLIEHVVSVARRRANPKRRRRALDYREDV